MRSIEFNAANDKAMVTQTAVNPPFVQSPLGISAGLSLLTWKLIQLMKSGTITKQRHRTKMMPASLIRWISVPIILSLVSGVFFGSQRLLTHDRK